MEGIVPRLDRRAKRRLVRAMRKCSAADLRTRYVIVLNLADGRSATETARVTKVARSTVYRVAGRFREAGEAGLIDRREDNGNPKIDQDFLGRLWEVVGSSPQRDGWSRPTWTRELLVEVMRRLTGVRVTVWTMSRALQQIGGSPRASAAHGGLPVVGAGQTAETAAVAAVGRDAP